MGNISACRDGAPERRVSQGRGQIQSKDTQVGKRSLLDNSKYPRLEGRMSIGEEEINKMVRGRRT